MTAQAPTLREALNNGVVQQLADEDRQIGIGDLLNLLIQAIPATQGALAVASNTVNLANRPSYIFDINATGGSTVTGRKQLLIGPSTLVPQTGQVVWDGNLNLRFAAADGVVQIDARYAVAPAAPQGVLATTVCSALQRTLGERD
jgi:hypothetical protein